MGKIIKTAKNLGFFGGALILLISFSSTSSAFDVATHMCVG